MRGVRPTLAALGIFGLTTSGVADAADNTSDATPQLQTVTVTGARPDDGYAPANVSVGSKQSIPLLELPQSVTVITAQRIEDQNLFTLGDLMQQVPGVSVMPFDGANPDFRARGYSLGHSYDGIPLANTGSGVQEFDLAIYERVEVLRGPSGLFMGSGQPGGTVNFVRKRGLAQWGAAAAASYGSWNNKRTEIDIGGPLDAAGRVRSRLVGTYQDRKFFYDSGRDRKWLGYAALDWDLTASTTVSFALTQMDDRLDAPETGLPAYTDGRFIDLPRATNVHPSWNRYTWNTTEYSAEVEHRLGNEWVVRAKALQREQDKYYKDGYPRNAVDPDTMTTTYTSRLADSDTTSRAVDLYATGPVRAWGRKHDVTLGYNFESWNNRGRRVTFADTLDVPITDPNSVQEPHGDYTTGSQSSTTQRGLYAQTRLSIADPLSIIAGGRLTDYKTRSRNRSPSPQTDYVTGADVSREFTPYGAVVLHLAPEATAYVSYSDIFMPQTTLDAQGDVLDPRVGRQVEVGTKARWMDGRLNTSLAYFHTSDVNRALPTDVPNVFTEAGEVTVQGIETEIGGTALPGLDLSAGYTYLQTKYRNHQSLQGEVFSTFEPKHLFKVYARYQPAAWQGVFVGGGVIVNSALLGGGEKGVREQGGYTVANAQLGYRAARGTTVTLSVNNLFDRHYYSRVGAANSYNMYGEPRSYMVSVRAPF